jgi:transformer-2 protein
VRYTLPLYLSKLTRVTCQLQKAPNPSNVLGVFGLSIRTQERDLDEEFSRFGRVEKVTIVYDQRVGSRIIGETSYSNFIKQSDRSRGFGFIRMTSVEEATRCIQELNGIVSSRALGPVKIYSIYPL